jgi:hypothetical protein
MNYRRIIGISSIVLLCIAGAFYLNRFFTTLGTLIFSYSLSFGLTLAVFWFSPEGLFRAWRNFALGYLPIAALLIAIAPTQSGGIMPIDKENVTMFTAALFVIISLFLIAVKAKKPDLDGGALFRRVATYFLIALALYLLLGSIMQGLR